MYFSIRLDSYERVRIYLAEKFVVREDLYQGTTLVVP